MRNSLFAICIIFIAEYSVAQKPLNQIEINPYLRWDSYPKFVYTINTVTSNTVKIKGTSWGIDAAYKFPFSNKFRLKTGFGYYKHSFNDVDQVNSLFGKNDNRIIDYTPSGPMSPSILYATNKYWYNSIVVTIGIEKYIDISKSLQLFYGVDIRNYYTFSQQYHIVYPVPEGTNYRRTDNRYFGFSANLNAGVRKKFGKTSIGPSIILPVYDIWKKDGVFPQEENNKSRKKWLKGFGVGISCNYSLSKKQ